MDNQTKSEFQQRFPLWEDRKFWKKILVKILPLFLLIMVPGTILSYIFIFTLISAQIANIDSFFTYLIYITSFVFVFFIVALITYAWYVKVYIKRYYYSGEPNFLTIKKGVFAPTEIHVQYQKIQDVYVDQDVLDRMMGLYDVHIASATQTSGIEAHIDGVNEATAEGLKQFLLDAIHNNGSRNNPSPTFNSTASNNVEGPAQKIVNLSEEISSVKYPLNSKWFASEVLKSFLGASFIFIVLGVGIFSKGGLMSLSALITILIYLVIFFVSFLWSVASTILWKKNYEFKFTDKYIYYKKGIFSIEEKHMPYSSIQDVSVSQGIIDRFFGISKVIIENAAQSQTNINSKGSREVINFAGIIIVSLTPDEANHITEVLKGIIFNNTGVSKNGL